MQLKSRMRNILFSTTLRQRCKSRIDVSARMLAQIPITSGNGKPKVEDQKSNISPTRTGCSTSTSSYDKTRRFQWSPWVTRIARNNSEKNILTTTACCLTARTTQREKKYFNYFVFNIVDCGLLRSGARHYALAQTIGNARGLDINSPRSAEAHTQDLRFRRHQQRDDPNNGRGLDNNFASDRDCDSTTITRLRHRRLRPHRPRRTR
jgi:hypothetical protein